MALGTTLSMVAFYRAVSGDARAWGWLFFMGLAIGMLAKGPVAVILTGILGFAVSFLLFGLAAGNLPLMYASRVLGGLFSGAVTSVIVAYVADITPP